MNPFRTPGLAAKITLLAALYLCQGLPTGFFTVAVPVLLRERGASLTVIGASSVLALPWMAKFVWASRVDAIGTRRGWILGLQVATVGLMVAIATGLDERALYPLLLAVFLTNLFAATQDIATDGLAVDLLGDDERGLGNAVQVAGYRAGMILGGGALLVLLDDLGWRAAFLAMAGILALCTVPVLLHQERRHTRPPSPGVFAFLRLPGVLPWLGVLGFFKLGEAMGTGMVKAWLVDIDLSKESIGWLLGVGGFGASLVGAMVGGSFVNRLGRRASLVLFGALQSLAVLGYGAAAWSGEGVQAAVLAEHFLSGMATTALFTVMMDACRPGEGGSDYTAQASVVVFAMGLGQAASGFIAESVGYPGLNLVGGVLSLAGALLMGIVPLWRAEVPART